MRTDEVMLKPCCPNCHSKSCDHYASYETQHNGTRKRYQCNYTLL